MTVTREDERGEVGNGPGVPDRPSPAMALGDKPALVILAGLTALAAWNRLSFDTWLARFDLFTFFLPWYAFLGERLRAFDIPGWNPHLFSGAPFAGDPESGWMYLPAMLFFPLLSAPMAFKAMVVLQLAVAGLSTYALARVLGMGATASLIAGVVYVVGPFLQWNTYCCLIFSQFATWIPLVLLGTELSLRASRWRDRVAPWFLAAFGVSQMFAGWAGEGWLYAVLLPAAYVGYRAVLSPPRPRLTFQTRLIDGVVTGIAVVGLGMALGAAGMLPRFAVNAETNLAGGDYTRLGDAGVLNPPWTLDYLLVQTIGAGMGYHFRAASLGGAVVVLSLLAIPMAGRRSAVPFFAGLTLVSLILTLDTTPLHHLFYLIPRYREFHDHDAWRTMALAAIGPAMLSGAAIESLPSWRGRRRLLPIVAVPLVLIGVVALVLQRSEMSIGWQPLVAAVLTSVLVGVVVAAPPTPGLLSGDRLATAVAMTVLAVIFVLPTGLEITGSWFGWPADRNWERHWRPDPVVARRLASEVTATDPGGAGEFLQEQLKESGPFRYAGYGGFGYGIDADLGASYMARRFDPHVAAMLVNGRAIFLGLYDIQGYNPLQLWRYVEFMNALNEAEQDYHTAFLLPSGVDSPLLDLLDVRYLVVDASLPPDREDVVALTAGRREVFRTDRVIVYEQAPTPPHAWIVHDVREIERGEALPLLTEGTIDPYQTALVEGAAPETGTPEDAAAESARVVAYEPDRLTITTNAAAPGLLVVSEVYASGWRASVDGVEAAVLPTNHALRGVPIPAGEHQVELRYEPLSLQIGLAISGVSILAMLVAFVTAGWLWAAGRPQRLG